MTDTQREKAHSMNIPEPLYQRIKTFAESNEMSVSEVLRGGMESFLSDSSPMPETRPLTRRVMYWADPELQSRFMEKVRAVSKKAGRRVTQHEVLAEVLEDIL